MERGCSWTASAGNTLSVGPSDAAGGILGSSLLTPASLSGYIWRLPLSFFVTCVLVSDSTPHSRSPQQLWGRAPERQIAVVTTAEAKLYLCPAPARAQQP